MKGLDEKKQRVLIPRLSLPVVPLREKQKQQHKTKKSKKRKKSPKSKNRNKNVSKKHQVEEK